GGEVGAVHVLRVEDVAQLVAGQAVERRVVSVQLGAQDGAARPVPAEGRTVVAEVAGERREVVGRVGQLEHAGDHEVEVGGGVGRGGQDGKLPDQVEVERSAANLLADHVVERQRVKTGAN